MALGDWNSIPRDTTWSVSDFGPSGAASTGPGRVDVLVRSGDGHARHNHFDGTTWTAWTDLGGKLAAEPSVVSWGPGRLDVFAIGVDDYVYHWYGVPGPDGRTRLYRDSHWPLAGPVAPQALTLCSWGDHRLDVFARGLDDDVLHLFYDPKVSATAGGWGPLRAGKIAFESLGGVVDGPPAAVCGGQGHINLFVVGQDRRVYNKWFGGHWTPAALAPWSGPIGDRPVYPGSVRAVSWDTGRLDLFALAAETTEDGLAELVHAFYDPAVRKWFPAGAHVWEPRGRTPSGLRTDGLSVVAPRPGRLDIVAVAEKVDPFSHSPATKIAYSMSHLSFDAGWHGWEGLGGDHPTDPGSLVATGPGTIMSLVAGHDAEEGNLMWSRS